MEHEDQQLLSSPKQLRAYVPSLKPKLGVLELVGTTIARIPCFMVGIDCVWFPNLNQLCSMTARRARVRSLTDVELPRPCR